MSSRVSSTEGVGTNDADNLQPADQACSTSTTRWVRATVPANVKNHGNLVSMPPIGLENMMVILLFLIRLVSSDTIQQGIFSDLFELAMVVNISSRWRSWDGVPGLKKSTTLRMCDTAGNATFDTGALFMWMLINSSGRYALKAEGGPGSYIPHQQRTSRG